MSGPAKTITSFNPWRHYLGTGVACAAMAFGVYALGVRPAADRREAASDRQARLHQQQESVTRLTGTAEDAKRRLAIARQATAALPLKLSPSTTMNQRLANLTDLANSASVKVDQIQPGQSTVEGDFQAVPIRLAGTGTYAACATFLHRLRNEFPDTAVRSFSATSSGPGNPATFHYDLVWHTLPDRAVTATASTPQN